MKNKPLVFNTITGCERLAGRECNTCHEVKLLCDFAKPSKRKGSYGVGWNFRTRCKTCDSKRSVEKRRDNPIRAKLIDRNHRIKYGKAKPPDQSFVYAMDKMMSGIISKWAKKKRALCASLKHERYLFKQRLYSTLSCASCGMTFIKDKKYARLCSDCRACSKDKRRSKRKICGRLSTSAVYEININRQSIIDVHGHSPNCAHCGCRVRFSGKQDTNYAHLDHIIPVSDPYCGDHTLENTQVLCFDCNLIKSNTVPYIDVLSHTEHILAHCGRQMLTGNNSCEVTSLYELARDIYAQR